MLLGKTGGAELELDARVRGGLDERGQPLRGHLVDRQVVAELHDLHPVPARKRKQRRLAEGSPRVLHRPSEGKGTDAAPHRYVAPFSGW